MMPYSTSLSMPISSTMPSPTQSACSWVTSKVSSLLSMIESAIALLACVVVAAAAGGQGQREHGGGAEGADLHWVPPRW